MVSSYSSLKAAKGGYRTAVDVEEFKVETSQDPDAWRADIELPGGTGPGVFMHALLEDVAFDSVDGLDFDVWRAQPEIDAIFDRNHRRYGIDPIYKNHAQQLVFRTLTAPLALPNGITRIADLTRERREVEFVFPIPEDIHPSMRDKVRGDFQIERGWIKGFIDLMFEFDGRVYFADWKTDTLHAWDDATLTTHVEMNYEMQAKLYSLAVARLYDLHDRKTFDRRFGGYVYFFLRGVDDTGRGIFVRRPSFKDVCQFERELVGTKYV